MNVSRKRRTRAFKKAFARQHPIFQTRYYGVEVQISVLHITSTPTGQNVFHKMFTEAVERAKDEWETHIR